jgi:hypothetical protein
MSIEIRFVSGEVEDKKEQIGIIELENILARRD